MTDLIEVMKGNVSFFIAYIVVICLQFFILPLIEIISDIGWIFTSIGTLAWLVFFMICILAFFIVPNFLVYKGIMTKDTNLNKMSNITQAVVFLLIGIIGTIMLSWIFPTMAGLFDYTWLNNLFWIALIIHWVLSIIIAPINKIINSK